MTLFRSDGDASGSDIYTYAMSSREQNGGIITFTQFKEGNIFTENRNNPEIGDESVNK